MSKGKSSRRLRASVVTQGGSAVVNPHGGVKQFSNDFCNGSIFIAHRPQPDSGLPFEYDRILTKNGARYRFEIQVQLCLKVAPRGPLWLGGELREGPMKLGLVTRSLCRVLLGLIKTQASKRGIDFRYSFGDADTYPNLTFPVLGADRLVFSDRPVQLPVELEEESGSFREQDGRYTPVDRHSVKLEAGVCLTFMFATSFLDFETWSTASIPGVGSLDLEQFWGVQPASVAIFDQVDGDKTRNVYCDFQLASVSGETESMAVERISSAKSATNNGSAGGSTEEEMQDTEIELVPTAVEDPAELADDDRSTTPSIYTANVHDDDGRDDSDDDRQQALEEDWETRSFRRQASDTLSLQEQLDHGRRDISSDKPADASNTSVSIPWYFCNSTRELWWCIGYQGRTCWRHHNQLEGLCSALDTDFPRITARSPVRELEHARRLATRLLTQGCSAPGLLEEFTRMDVSLDMLLAGDVEAKQQAVSVGIVEAEGRITERFVELKRDTLKWAIPGSQHRGKVRVDLKNASLTGCSIAGAEAVKLATSQKTYVFVTKDRRHRSVVEGALTGAGVEDQAQGAQEQGGYKSILRTVADRIADAAGRVPGADAAAARRDAAAQAAADAAARIRDVAADAAARVPGVAAAAARVRDAAAPRPTSAFRDVLMRWPTGRIVINDMEPFLEPPPADALAFSAALLRNALDAQGKPEAEVNDLTIRTGQLKCISMDGLDEQDLWCFWVNLYHCLLLHAQLVLGQPSGLPQAVGFYNNSSYVVAGHVFSLVEIEHLILRRQLSKPGIFVRNAILKTWKRKDADYEWKPSLAAPMCKASCFVCRPDWRLNLVLSAGNYGGSSAIPVFESTSKDVFDRAVRQAMDHTLACCGRVSEDSITLPYTLLRYKDDAPPLSPSDTPEQRWAKALVPKLAETCQIVYSQSYEWKMRERLDALPTEEARIAERSNKMSI